MGKAALRPIGDDVEFVILANAPGKYLLSDLMEGSLIPLTDEQISNVKISPAHPCKGTEDNWLSMKKMKSWT